MKSGKIGLYDYKYFPEQKAFLMDWEQRNNMLRCFGLSFEEISFEDLPMRLVSHCIRNGCRVILFKRVPGDINARFVRSENKILNQNIKPDCAISGELLEYLNTEIN